MFFAAISFAVAVVVGGGFTALWYQQADSSRQALVHLIDTANELKHPMAKNRKLLRYDQIQASGYPFRVTLTIKNPTLTIPLSELFSKNTPSAQRAKRRAPVPQWTQELSTGALTVSHTIFSGNDIDVRLAAPLHTRSLVNARLQSETIMTAKDFTCHLQTDFFTRPDSAFSCRIAGQRTEDGRTHAPVSKLDTMTLAWSNRPSLRHARALALQLHVRGERYFPAADAIMRQGLQNIFAVNGLPKSQPTFISLAKLGNMTGDVDIAYDGPVHVRDGMQTPSKLAISQLDFSSALYKTSFTMHAASDGDETVHNASLSMHARADINDTYTQLLRTMYSKNAKLEHNPRIAQYERASAAAVPNFRGLGTLAFDIEGSGRMKTSAKIEAPATTPASAAPTTTPAPALTAKPGPDYDLTLQTLALGAKPYGLELHGTSASADDVPTTDLLLTIRNADRLLGDFGQYGKRVEAALSPRRRSAFFTPQTIAAARAFAHSLADNYEQTKPNILIHVQQSGTHPLTINDKDAMELFMLFQSAFPAPVERMQALLPTAQYRKPGGSHRTN